MLNIEKNSESNFKFCSKKSVKYGTIYCESKKFQKSQF